MYIVQFTNSICQYICTEEWYLHQGLFGPIDSKSFHREYHRFRNTLYSDDHLPRVFDRVWFTLLMYISVSNKYFKILLTFARVLFHFAL